MERQPLYNAIMQNALDAGGFPVINLPAENLKQVWISNVARTDGATGTGTRTDPYDGSTQAKFDAVMRSYFDASTTDIIFHLSPGTFYSLGYWDLGADALSWGMLSGWHIKGAGMNLTHVIQVAGAAGAAAGINGGMFQAGAALVYDNQSVEDLWCDCAYARSGPSGDNSRPHAQFFGVKLYGENCFVRNVRVTNCGCADSVVAPAIEISGGFSDVHLPHNALIENCFITDAGDLNGLGTKMVNYAALDADASPIRARKGRIIGNDINIPVAGNGSSIPEGFDSGLVWGNRIACAFYPIAHVQGGGQSRNIVIANNYLESGVAGFGIRFTTGTQYTRGLWIVDNIIVSDGGIALWAYVSASLIGRNRIYLCNGASGISSINLQNATVSNITVLDNIIDTGIPYINTGTTGISFRGNRTPGGQIVIPDDQVDTAVPTTVFVSKSLGNDSTGARTKEMMPFLTINAALTAAVSGDTVDVMDGVFDERIDAKNNITVRFRPQARLFSTAANVGCIRSTATSQKFTVYHEHIAMTCTGDSAIGLFINHAGCLFEIHGDITANVGATQFGVKVADTGTLTIFGDIYCLSGTGVYMSAAGNIKIYGNITAPGDYAVETHAGTFRVYGGTISGQGTAGAVYIDASAGQQVYDRCNIVSTFGAGHAAVYIGVVGSSKPVFRDCVFSADSGAAQCILCGAAQGVRLYGPVQANSGANPPTNITFEGPGSLVVGAPIVLV